MPQPNSRLDWLSEPHKTLVWILFLFLFFPANALCGQTWKWTTETVDAFGVQGSIAIDKDHNVHVSYFSGGIKYGFRPAGSSRWFTMNIAPSGGYSEIFSRVFVDSSGDPSICFTPGGFKLASFKNHAWNIQQVDPQSGTIEYTCSLVIGKDNVPRLTWYQESIAHMKYADLENGVWLARVFDSDMQTGKWNSMVLDSDGNPHISYDVFTKGELKYAFWDGKDWHRTVVDSPAISPEGSGGAMGNSLVLNQEGKAQISYENGDAVKYAWERDGSWKIDTIQRVSLSGSWAGYRAHQALDPQGNPHVVYEDGGVLKEAYWNGAVWQIQIISGAGVRRHRYEDIAIDTDGVIYIIFQDATDGSLKVAVGHPDQQLQVISRNDKLKK
jgi:hypothetical protein